MESSSYTGSSPTSKSTNPFIQIDSISIDLPNNKSKIEVATCDHFCIRKYVSEMRMKNSTACWPFDSDGGNEVPKYTLPPIDVPKFRWWKCQSCLPKTATNNEGSSIEKPPSCKCKSGSPCTHELTEIEAAKLVSKFKDIVSLDMVETRRDDNDVSAQANAKKSRGSDNPLKELGSDLRDDVHLELPRQAAVLGRVEAMAQQQVTNGGRPSSQHDYPCSSNQQHGNLEFGDIGHSAENLQNQRITSSCKDEQVKLGGLCEASGTHKDLIAEKGCSPFEELDEISSDSTEICPGSRNKSSGLQRRKVRKIRLLSDLLGQKENSSIKVSSPLLADSDGSEEVGRSEFVKKGLHGQKRKMIIHSDDEQETTVTEKNQARNSATTSEAVTVSGSGKDGCGKISPNSVIKRNNERHGCVDEPASMGMVVKKRLKKKNQITERTFQKKVGGVRCKAVVPSVVENEASMWKMIDLNDEHKEEYEKVEMKEKKRRKKTKKKVSDEPPFYDNNAGESCMCKKKTKLAQIGGDCDPSITRTGFGAVQSISSDAVHSKDGQSAERNRTVGVEESGPSFSRPEEEDGLLKKPAKTRTVELRAPSTSSRLNGPLGKEVNPPDLLSKGGNHGMTSVCEMQSYTSHSKGADPLLMPHKDNAGLGDKEKTVSQNQKGSVFKKHCSDVARQEALSDDIPMEIVELMAKIQYENRLHDASSAKETPDFLQKQTTTVKPPHQPKTLKTGTSGPTKPKAVHFSSQTSHGAFSPYHRDNKSPQLASQQNAAPVNSWSSAVLLDSPPKKRTPPNEFLNFQNPNAEKSQMGLSLQLRPPQQNGLNLQNQLTQRDYYASEKIPALNLLSLMDAGRSSGQNSHVRVNPPSESSHFLHGLDSVTSSVLRGSQGHRRSHGHQNGETAPDPKCRSQGLDLASAGSSGQNSRLNANPPPSFVKQQTVPHVYRSKESAKSDFIPVMNLAMCRKMPKSWNISSLNYPATMVTSDSAAYGGNGNSSWLLQPNPHKIHDKGKRKIDGFTAQKPVSVAPAVQISQSNFINPVMLPQKGIEIGKQNRKTSVRCQEVSSGTEICMVNRNPADFSILEPNNIYTIWGCDIKSDFRRTLPLLIAQEKMERETKRQVTAADLLAELYQNE